MSKENIDRLTYALYKGLESFNRALEEYEDRKGNLDKSVVVKEIASSLHQVTVKYNISLEKFLESIFPEYQPFLNIAKKMRLEEIMEMSSEILKEYGADGNLNKSILKFAGRAFLKDIFRGQNE